MARPKNTEERRKQIAGALVSVMAKRGYDGASINSVAAEAGLTSGLVHYHFKNKQEILLFALENLVTAHRAALSEIMENAKSDPLREVRTFIDFHLGLGTNADPDALACWVLLSGEALRQASIREAYENAIALLVEQLASIITRGMKSKAFGRTDAKAAAAALFATIQGYYVLAATARRIIPRGSAARSMKLMAEGLLQPKPKNARKKPRRKKVRS